MEASRLLENTPLFPCIYSVLQLYYRLNLLPAKRRKSRVRWLQTAVQARSLVCVAAPQDAPLLATWENHLLPLQQAGHLSFWSERALLPGDHRLQRFFTQLNQAEVIIFLVSVDLFASEECYQFMEYALQLHRARGVKVLPLLTRNVSWRSSPLGEFICLPTNEIPVKLWSNEDEGWHTCVLELQRLLGISWTQALHTPLGAPNHSDRSKFLRLLQRDYQKELDKSLERLVWQELDLHERPDAVLTRFSQRCSDQSERALPAGMSILRIYDEAAGALLLLGEPGAGKSTLLITLGLDLLARAESDLAHPLPAILPLSSWAESRPALDAWLVEQLTQRYGVPGHLGKVWLQERQILPVLDGLDEMEETARIQCITAINTYSKATFSSLVVCSRTSEYQAASAHHRLALQQAVIIQPLTEEHILYSVRQGGTALAALADALTASEELLKLAKTPLMLNIMMLTYHDTTMPESPQQREALEKQIWQHYLERMIREKGAECRDKGDILVKRYAPAQTYAWLAQQMRQHNQTVFSGEYLQHSWLPLPLLARSAWLDEVLPAMLLGTATSIFLAFLLTWARDMGSLCRVGLVGGFLGWCFSVRSRSGHGGETCSPSMLVDFCVRGAGVPARCQFWSGA